jgi:hypothetical protein
MKNDFQIEITRLYIQILLFIVRTNYVLVKRARSLSVYVIVVSVQYIFHNKYYAARNIYVSN